MLLAKRRANPPNLDQLLNAPRTPPQDLLQHRVRGHRERRLAFRARPRRQTPEASRSVLPPVDWGPPAAGRGAPPPLFLLYRLRPFSANLGARHVKTPKLLLADTGMAAALIGVDASRYCAPDQGALAGMLFETFVLMEIIKQTTWSITPVELFYRDTDKREVGLVVESASGDIVGIEAKSASSATASDARGLRLLRDKLGARFKAGVIVYSGAHTLPVDERIWAMPISGLWRYSMLEAQQRSRRDLRRNLDDSQVELIYRRTN
jgi:hypothetical protein